MQIRRHRIIRVHLAKGAHSDRWAGRRVLGIESREPPTRRRDSVSPSGVPTTGGGWEPPGDMSRGESSLGRRVELGDMEPAGPQQDWWHSGSDWSRHHHRRLPTTHQAV